MLIDAADDADGGKVFTHLAHVEAELAFQREYCVHAALYPERHERAFIAIAVHNDVFATGFPDRRRETLVTRQKEFSEQRRAYEGAVLVAHVLPYEKVVEGNMFLYFRKYAYPEFAESVEHIVHKPGSS